MTASVGDPPSYPPVNCMVVGCGFMGLGIASVLAAGGNIVYLVDVRGKPYLLKQKEELCKTIAGFWREDIGLTAETSEKLGLKKGLSFEEVLDQNLIKVWPDQELQPGFGNSKDYPLISFIFEAVFEDLTVKCDTFAKLYRHFTGARPTGDDAPPFSPRNPLICSNTSSLDLSTMKKTLQDGPYHILKFPTLVCAHFVGPALKMPFVELWSDEGYKITEDYPEGDPSSPALRLLTPLANFLERRCGKKTVCLRKQSAGFLHARLQAVLMRECYALIEQGVCSREDIDRTVVYGFGRRYNECGPVAQGELVGEGLLVKTHNNIWPQLCNGSKDSYSEGRIRRKKEAAEGAPEPDAGAAVPSPGACEAPIEPISYSEEVTLDAIKGRRDAELTRRFRQDVTRGEVAVQPDFGRIIRGEIA